MSSIKIFSSENHYIELLYNQSILAALKLSSFLEGLLNDYEVTEYLNNNKKLIIPNLKENQLVLFEKFIKTFYGQEESAITRLNDLKVDYYFISNSQTNKYKEILFEQQQGLQTFYNEELGDLNALTSYYEIADFLGISLLEKLILIKVVGLYQGVDANSIDKMFQEKGNKTISLLKEKYFAKCEENIEALDKEQIEKILMED